MYVRKPDGSITSVVDGTPLQAGWVEVSEDVARAEHPALTGDDQGSPIVRAGQSPLSTIPDYPTVGQVGEIDPRVIEATPSEPNR